MSQDRTEHRKLAAIMFTDMVGYSALAQRNEALALELLEEHRRLIRPIFPRFNGQEIETAGDAFLVEFASALEATKCAVEIQRLLSERNQNQPAERHIRLRIGIHVGDVVHKDGKVMGDAVNIAARIEPLAEPGGICISNAVFEQVRNKVELPLVRLGEPELKNIEVPVIVFKVVLDGAVAADVMRQQNLSRFHERRDEYGSRQRWKMALIPSTTPPLHREAWFKRHWRKLTVSVAGLVAFAAILTIPNSLMDLPLKWRELFKPEIPTASQVAEVVAKSIASLREAPKTTLFERDYPGYSAHLLLRLGNPVSGRDNFVFDFGQNAQSNRISLYLDRSRNLCFRVIDSDSQPFLVKVAPALQTFSFGNVLYLRCDYGSTQDFSFVRIVINGNEVAEKHQNAAIVISQPFAKMDYVQGADLDNENGGVMDLRLFISYTNTLANSNALQVIRSINTQLQPNQKHTWVVFSGNQSLMRFPSGRAPGRTTAPIIRHETN